MDWCKHLGMIADTPLMNARNCMKGSKCGSLVTLLISHHTSPMILELLPLIVRPFTGLFLTHSQCTASCLSTRCQLCPTIQTFVRIWSCVSTFTSLIWTAPFQLQRCSSIKASSMCMAVRLMNRSATGISLYWKSPPLHPLFSRSSQHTMADLWFNALASSSSSFSETTLICCTLGRCKDWSLFFLALMFGPSIAKMCLLPLPASRL